MEFRYFSAFNTSSEIICMIAVGVIVNQTSRRRATLTLHSGLAIIERLEGGSALQNRTNYNNQSVFFTAPNLPYIVASFELCELLK
jgi:hypothetical protein